METNNFSELKEFCNRLTAQGEELKITWEGGNDSGFLTLYLDDREILQPESMVNTLLDYAHEELGYGSFAGDFSTSGSAVYDREEGWFSGSDFYSQSEGDEQECSIKIRIPADLWFDRLDIRFSGNFETGIEEMETGFDILNGPVIPEHSHWEENIADELKTRVWEELKECEKFENTWANLRIERNEFKQEDNSLTYTLEAIPYSYYKSTDNEIFISLTD